MQSVTRTLSTLLLVTLGFAVTADAKRVKLKIGDDAPTWTNLIGVDAEKKSLDDLNKAKAVAIVFTCNSCPVAQSYVARLSALSSDFAKRGVVVVAINADKTEDLAAMKKYAKKHKVTYDYLRDASQKVAKSYGALLTPEVFLLDADHKIAYMGAIDDDVQLTGHPKRRYLRDAIEAILVGKEPVHRTTRAMGCAIKWK